MGEKGKISIEEAKLTVVPLHFRGWMSPDVAFKSHRGALHNG